MALTRPVRLEQRSREELVRYLEFKLDAELPEDEARDRTDAYAMLGLVPADLDLRAVLLGLYTEQVAGFYEPDSTALFVLDDQPEEALQALLVHELVHALQDQTADLDAPGSGVERLRRMGEGYVRFALENPAHYRLMYGREALTREDLPELREAANALFDQFV